MRNACVVLFVALAVTARASWLAPPDESVHVTETAAGRWTVTSSAPDEFTLESSQRYDATPGDVFEIGLRIRSGITTRALPELVCYDAQDREIPVPSSLATGNPNVTTDWQAFKRVFPVRPGTASVRARVRGRGNGEILLADLAFRPSKVNAYETGALITQPHAKTRVGVVLESNHGVVNRELLSTEDRDGDGKWAIVPVDLDGLTAPEKKGEDWRTNFEDNPNAILWSGGVVLKSDTVTQDRAPDAPRALHFRMRAHEGPYTVWVSDPGRAAALSLDGKTWKRYEGGSEIALGDLEMRDGVLEFWLDACYRDPVTAGPVYFDYVRMMPALGAPSVDRLFEAARKKPQPIHKGSVEERRVAVTVNAPPFAHGAHWPVRCGLPVPRGELPSADNVAVTDAAGAAVPCQARVTASWPDGSVKWLFLDFAHDFSRSGDGRYTVMYGNNVHPAKPQAAVRIEPTPDGLEVDTGAIRFNVSKSHFGLVENVRLANGQTVQREPIAAEIVESGGKTWRALDLPAAKVSVEQPGPLHAVLLVETKLAESGKPSSGFYHRARIHAFAGSPLLQIDYFVANTDSRPAKKVEGSMSSKVMVKSITLKLKPAAAIGEGFFDGGQAGASGAVIQKTDDLAVLDSGGGPREMQKRVSGWASLGLQSGGSLAAGVEAFREQFPKALRWNAKELEIALWAPEGGDYEWIEGVGKTHHLSLFYGTEQAGKADLLAAGPVLALASPDWYTTSGAFGPQTLAQNSGMPAVEKTLAEHIAYLVVNRVGVGFENYGDHSSGGYVKGTFLWDNNEYDLPAGCMVHFVRTGDRAALRIGLASALHYLDVDTIHYSSRHADWARAQHVHSHALFGGHTAQGPDFHHAGYVQGLIWYSYFTGEPIGILGARGIADWCVKHAGVQTGAMERALGHPLMTFNDVYEATGDETYLRASAKLVDQALKWEHPQRSGFLAPITESPAYYSGCPFNSGLVPSALMKFNSWAHEPEIDQMLERVAQWTLTDMWHPPADILTKGGSPRRGGNARHIASHGRLMALEFARTGDPFFLVVPRLLTIEGFGEKAKTIGTRETGLVFNYLPWLLTSLKENGNPDPDPQLELTANAAQANVPRGGTVKLCFIVKNSGQTEVKGLRTSFRSRVDVKVTPDAAVPEVLAPGQTAEFWYTVQAPEAVNTVCQCDRIAYGHWSALYQREGKAHLAHQTAKLTIRE